jgi:hypothetical protein
MKVQVNFDPPSYRQTEIDMTLHLSGGSYAGTATSKISTCGNRSKNPMTISSFAKIVTNTITMTIAPDKQRDGEWTAWHAAMQLSAPDTFVNDPVNGAEECPPQSWDFTVAGHPAPGP